MIQAPSFNVFQPIRLEWTIVIPNLNIVNFAVQHFLASFQSPQAKQMTPSSADSEPSESPWISVADEGICHSLLLIGAERYGASAILFSDM
jgi:hypothetical protein